MHLHDRLGVAVCADGEKLGVAKGLRGLRDHHPEDANVLRGDEELAEVVEQQDAGWLPPDDLGQLVPHGLQDAGDRAAVVWIVVARGVVALGERAQPFDVLLALLGERQSQVVDVVLDGVSLADLAKVIGEVDLRSIAMPSFCFNVRLREVLRRSWSARATSRCLRRACLRVQLLS
jgi:hypothetical protein